MDVEDAIAADADVGNADAHASCNDEAVTLGSYADEVTKDSPYLYLRFGENGPPTAHDTMGHADGTYTAGGVTYGVPGALLNDSDTAIQLDGTGKITMPVGVDFQGMLPFTLEVWANEAPGNGLGWLMDHSGFPDACASPDRNSWAFYLSPDNPGLTIERRGTDCQTTGSVVSAGSASLNVYHHVVTTFDGQTRALYLDGNKATSTTGGGTSIPGTGTGWTIAGENCGCSGNFIGSLDEVAVYPSALAPARVCAHYLASGRP
jgi:hypothetical protein